MNHWRIIAVVSAVTLSALSRLLDAPPNVTPILSMALLSGATLSDRRLALAVPLAAMLLADAVIGMHVTVAFVYLPILLIVLIGFRITERRPAQIVVGSLAGSVLFFVVSNFGFWLMNFELTWPNLVQCYVQAIPFFRNTVISTLLYSGVLFGGFALLESLIPEHRKQAVPASEHVS